MPSVPQASSASFPGLLLCHRVQRRGLKTTVADSRVREKSQHTEFLWMEGTSADGLLQFPSSKYSRLHEVSLSS